MLFATIAAAAETEHDAGAVMLQTFPFGLIAFVVFSLLAFVTLSYRNVSNRHAPKGEAYARAHANDVQRARHGH